MKKHLNIAVYGRVQGVWFRKSTQTKALDLGIKGFVKNETDGSVYIEAEGDQEVLAQFEAWCQIGPELASVQKVVVNEGEWKEFKDFRIG